MVQKLIDLNNPGLQIYPDLDMNGANPTPYNFGLYKLFSETGKFKISKIMPCNTSGTGVIGSYFFECPYYHYMSTTNSFPMLMKSDYSDGQLMEFATTSPSPTVHTYPRIMGNIGLGNEYNFLDYLNRWYPSHTAHHMPLNTYPDESYIMGSTLKHALMPTGYPEFNILMRTENYNFLRCITFEEQTQNDFITTDFFSVLPSSNTYFFINHEPFDTLRGDHDIEGIECDEDVIGYGFKNIDHKDSEVIYKWVDNKLFFLNQRRAKSLNLYSSSGQLIQKIAFQNEIDLNHLSTGLYFIHFLDENNRNIQASKIIKQ
jgi:hypothetical protein